MSQTTDGIALTSAAHPRARTLWNWISLEMRPKVHKRAIETLSTEESERIIASAKAQTEGLKIKR